jgi:large subunit ribosomal protein L32e
MLKKKHPKFNVPNYGTKKRDRVKARWRKQRGIDNKKRIKKAFAGAEPTIGYKNMDSMIGVRVNGNKIMLVHSTTELQKMIKEDMLKGYDVTIAKGVSNRKRAVMTELAQKSSIKVTNGVYK